jgi:hypothetical protein
MGLLVAYSAAMHRVLIGLESAKLYDMQDMEAQCAAEQASEGGEEEDNDGRREKARAAARLAAFAPLSARLARCCGASIPPETLREMCTHNGEFDEYAHAFGDLMEAHCELTNDCRLMDEELDGQTFLEAARAAARRLERGGVSRAELRQRPYTLEMFILMVAHRLATRMRTKAVRKAA